MKLSLAAFLTAAALLASPPPEEWSPARWPSHDPATLQLLKNTPVNCLLLEPAHWDRDFVEAASKAGVIVLAVLRPDTRAAAPNARTLPFNGIVLEGDFEQPPDTGSTLRIELPSRAAIRLDTPAPIVGTSQALWPGLEIEHSGKTVTGPTSAPWIYTNGGFLRFLRAATHKTVWLGVQPPARTLFPVERYLQAIGDAAIAGARWVLSFDTEFQERLFRNEPDALRDWKRVGSHLRFYDQWRRSSSYGRFGVITDRGSGALLSSFLLDMLAAQRTSAIVIPPGQIGAAALQDLLVVLDLQPSTRNASDRQVLKAFSARGGVVLTPPDRTVFPPVPTGAITPSRRDLDRLQALWELIYNATLRKNFGVRAFNTAGVLTGIAANGRGIVVHLLNFTDYEGEAITVHALGHWKNARLYLPDRPPRQLHAYAVKEGTAVDIERVATAAAIVFESASDSTSESKTRTSSPD